MIVADRMTRTVHTCRFDDSLEFAARLLWEHDCGVLPVLDAHEHLRGMVTDRDICMAAWTTGLRLSDLQVREAMAIDLGVVRATDSLQAAEAMMRRHRVRRLPVVDDLERVLGLISCNDLVRHVDDAVAQGWLQLAAVNLVHTLAVIGAPRGARPGEDRHVPAVVPAGDADLDRPPVSPATPVGDSAGARSRRPV